jgi:hypothetical protein
MFVTRKDRVMHGRLLRLTLVWSLLAGSAAENYAAAQEPSPVNTVPQVNTVPPPVVTEQPAATCRKNPFNRDTAEPLPLALTDWHCSACQGSQLCRAGCPDAIRAHALYSNNSHYCGSLVGGGSLFGGSGPCPHEGTWGWDYLGTFHRKRVWLHWNHGTHGQGGRGAYKTDGPKLHLHE